MSNQIPVTRLPVGEYVSVFGGRRNPIQVGETIIDIGSGDSDLSPAVPEGTLFQIDPIYGDIDAGRLMAGQSILNPPGFHRGKQPLGVYKGLVLVNAEAESRKKPVLQLFSALEGLKPNRVTTANTLKHLTLEKRIKILARMLQLVQADGIAQIYPTRGDLFQGISSRCSNFGIELTRKFVVYPGTRPIAYTAVNMNWATTVRRIRKGKFNAESAAILLSALT